MGGYDKYNLSQKVLKILLTKELKLDEINVLSAFKYSSIKKLVSDKVKIKYHPFKSGVLKLLSMNDLLISSGGTIIWDKCLINIPSITIPISKNQLYNTRFLNQIGGTIMIKKINDIPKKLKLLNKEKIKSMQSVVKSLCDYNGLKRIKKEIRECSK